MSGNESIRSILVDGKNLALRHGTGVASYARSLCKNLTAMGKRVEVLYGEAIRPGLDANERALEFFDPDARRSSLPPIIRPAVRIAQRQTLPLRRVDPLPLPLANAAWSQQYAAMLPAAQGFWNARDVFDMPSWAVKRGHFQKVRNVMGVDAAHWTYPVPVRLEGAANIYTVHDLVPLKLPDTTLDNKRAYHAMIKKIVESADLILTVSDQSKSDIHELFDIADDRVVNTYQDVDVQQALLDESEDDLFDAIRGVHGLEPGGYFLFYGAIEPKKNVGRLIEAHLSSNSEAPLVIVGKNGWLFEKELRLYDQHLQRRIGPQRIIRIPYVPRNQLINLIRGACAVAFPSLYEGFGLPVVEAMICGTPVLTSNCGAMKEIAGSAAVLVDPYDSASIRDGLKRLTSDSELRKDLIIAGRERAQLFSSEQYRARLAEAYARL